MWPRQKENSRQVFLKRAQAYHAGRIYFHSLYRRRSALDDLLLEDLVDLSMSPYTRVRRYSLLFLVSMTGTADGGKHPLDILRLSCTTRAE